MFSTKVVSRYSKAFAHSLVAPGIFALVVITAAVAITHGRSAADVRVARPISPTQTTDARVGANIGDIAPGSGSGVVFVDAMKQAAPWSSSAGSLLLDSAGNVRSLGAHQVAETVTYAGAVYPAGDYTLLYDGQGTFDFSGAGGTVLTTAPGRIVLRIAPTSAGIRLRLTSTNSSNYVRSVRLILPGFLGSYESVPFHPLFVQRLRPFNVLRFKDWMHGDTFVSSLAWPQRATTMRFTQVSPNGVALEYMIALANATGDDPWFTIPVGATDAYISSFAQLVHQGLDPRLHAYFELGHEVWRAGTPANAYATRAGRSLHLAADPASAALGWYAVRSVQLFDSVKRGFGSDAGRVGGVLSGPLTTAPNSTEALVDRTVLSYAAAAQHADAFGVAARNDGGISAVTPGEVASMSPARVLSALEANLGYAGGISRETSYTASIAQAMRLPLVAYDGSDALEPGRYGGAAPAVASLFATVGRLPGMRQVYRDSLETWHAAGGSLFVAKTFVRAASSTQSAGLLERLDQPLSTAYELQGVNDYMARHLVSHVQPLSAAGLRGSSALRISATAAANKPDAIAPGRVNAATYHYDALRTGWNKNEQILTPATVSSSFGLLTSVALDDQVDAQPLVVTNLKVGGQIHNVVYVATEGNTVYAIDASSGSILLSKNLGTPVPQAALPGQCNNNGPNVGIDSTPTIDLSTRTVYVIAYTYANGTPQYTIHALNLTTLKDKIAPAVVTASHTLSDGTIYTFNAAVSRQRPALLEANGNIYAGFGGFCDVEANLSRGWLLGWNAQSLAPLAVNQLNDRFATSPNGFFQSSIWMSGYGVAADATGNVFFVTANSDFSGTTYDGVNNIQESVVKEAPDLSGVSSIFTPSDSTYGWPYLDQTDNDFGSGGVLLLPDQPGKIPRLAVAAGKVGQMYLMNRDSLGGYNPLGVNNVLGTYSIGGCFCGQSYFRGQDGVGRVVSSGGTQVIVWKVHAATLAQESASQSLCQSVACFGQDAGSFTSISSNGTQAGTAIIWTVSRPANNSPADVTLYAFNGANAAQTLFSATAGTWPYTTGNANIVPVVANGYVYVASYKQLAIFGTL